jgi:uncharacterized protein (TIGR04255 family)
MGDFGEYLTAAPRIPLELPQHVTRFLSRVSIVRADAVSAVITQAFEGIVGPKNVTVLLDIDTFKQEDFSEEDIWVVLEELHDFKNEIFFSSLTEEAVRLFE